MPYPKNRARVVLVVLKRNTAVAGPVGIKIGALHAVVGESGIAPKAGRIMALREDTSGKARALAVSVGHVLAWSGTGRAGSALPVEEDQEDEGADKSQTSNHTDDNTGDRTSAEAR